MPETNARPASGPRAQPIFILGMLPRSGTNHLTDLFEMHADTQVMKPIFEDALVRHAHHLRGYVDDVTGSWTPEWGVPETEGAALMAALGNGITTWMQGHVSATKTVVTKMPNLENAEHFFDLFPEAHMVLLVRDGRSVCESGHRSFGQSREYWFNRFQAAGDKAVALQAQHGHRPNFHLLRYEDVIADRAAAMVAVLPAVGLAQERFPYDKIDHMPVRGSSELSASGELHWQPVAAAASFDPNNRWQDWDASTHRLFARVAGPTQEALGYSCEAQTETGHVRERLFGLGRLAEARLREQRLFAKRALQGARRATRRV